MKSTGEVMGIDSSFGLAFAKSQLAAGQMLPTAGNVLLSVRDHDKPALCTVAEKFHQMGFGILATRGTAAYLNQKGIPAKIILKVSEGRPHVVDRIKNGDIQMVVNTSLGKRRTQDSYLIRRACVEYRLPYATTIASAYAMAQGIDAIRHNRLTVKTIQEYTS